MSGGKKFAALVDLSGTLHVENSITAGAVEALQRLRKIPQCGNVLFVTNTTKESGRFLHDRLTKLGFQIDRSEIFSSLIAAKNYIVDNRLNPMLLLKDSAMEDFEDIRRNGTDKPLNSVLIGLAPSKFDYKTMNDAFNLLLEKGTRLIAVHKGRYYKTEKGLNLGPGPFVAALEYATDKTAEIVGKPEKSFFEAALEKCSCSDPSQAFMIGDDVKDDIDGAQKVGMKGILVKTGKYRPGDERKISPEPWKVAENFAQAVEIIEDYVKNS